MTHSTRRDFLQLCGLAGLGLAIPIGPRAIRAAEKQDESYPGPHYVVFNASGGWDTTYLMDPKGVNEIDRLYAQGDILNPDSHRGGSPCVARCDDAAGRRRN